MFLSVLSIELSKIFSKGRSYIGFGAITILVPIVQAAMYSEGEAYFSLCRIPIKDRCLSGASKARREPGPVALVIDEWWCLGVKAESTPLGRVEF